ncbi:hypothetical protein BUH_1312 [Burkholderia pseudomallei Pakistan 9]|nr:hypothetical protein BUH_1312 [Burkholderia pseudomallei Pakistan 9]
MAVEEGSAKHLTPRCCATFQPGMKQQDTGTLAGKLGESARRRRRAHE